MGSMANHAKRQAEVHVAEWVETYARIGIAAKGVVYVLVGVLAAMAVFSAGGGNNGKEGAFRVILTQPFGQVLLGAVAVGLVGYVFWRMIQAFSDPDGYGNDTEGITRRTGFFISGLVYLFFAFSAVRMLIPGGSSG